MARQFCRWEPDLKMIGLRFSNVMDPEDYARVPRRSTPTRELRRWNLWAYIDGRDGAQAVRRALEHDAAGLEVFVIANADTVMSRRSARAGRGGLPGRAGHAGSSASTRRCCRSTRRAGCWATSRSTAGGADDGGRRITRSAARRSAGRCGASRSSGRSR